MRRNTLLVTLGTSLVASACVEKGEPFGPTPAIDHRFAAASVAAVPTRYAVQLDGQPSFAQAINQSGTAVGANSSGNAGGFLAGESIGGLTPGYGNAIAFGINDAGAIVGTDALLGPWISTAFGPATPLSAPSGAGSGLGNARAISNGGVIVGDWPAARTGKLKPVVWDAQGSATMYNDVDPVDDCDAAARNISPNSAYVAGWSEVGCLSGGQSTHAVRWANGTPTDLGPGTANDVTDGGIVVGVGFATRHAMVWDGGTAIDIHPATFCTESIGMAVVQSLAGDVLAAGMCTVGIQTLGVVWSRNAGWAPIALLDAFSAVAHDAYPYDINSSGVLVGLAGDHSGGREYAAVWDLGNHPPTVSLAGPIVGTEGVMLQLSATVADPDGDALVVDWDFGDGSPHGAGASVGHAYAAPGTYTVTVTATDPLGLSGRTSTTANIAPAGGINVPPVADAGGPYVGAEGAAIA
ncbi:MAG: PKD domain-containing protein, partial [Gemmatimonadaceae bacterium]